MEPDSISPMDGESAPGIPSPQWERAGSAGDAAAVRPLSRTPRLIPQMNGDGALADSGIQSAGYGWGEPAFVYALGKVEARFPTLAVEKEFMQATGRSDTKGQTDQGAFHTVLSQRSNRYLARKLCWVLMVEGLETYILTPRDPLDLDLLIEAVRPQPSPLDVDVVIGMRGPIAPPEACNGLMLPVVAYDQIYSFDAPALIQAIPKPAGLAEKQFRASSQEYFNRVMQMADNAGATDDHRALNYLAVRYPALYSTVADAYARNQSLSAVDVEPSRLGGSRRIVDVIFAFTHRETGVVDRQFVRVDVSEEFPFLVTPMSPYFGR